MDEIGWIAEVTGRAFLMTKSATIPNSVSATQPASLSQDKKGPDPLCVGLAL